MNTNCILMNDEWRVPTYKLQKMIQQTLFSILFYLQNTHNPKLLWIVTCIYIRFTDEAATTSTYLWLLHVNEILKKKIKKRGLLR